MSSLDSVHTQHGASHCFDAICMLQLTGELPFKPVKAGKKPIAPELALSEDEEEWEQCRTILQLQTQYVSTAILCKYPCTCQLATDKSW